MVVATSDGHSSEEMMKIFFFFRRTRKTNSIADYSLDMAKSVEKDVLFYKLWRIFPRMKELNKFFCRDAKSQRSFEF